MKTIFAALDPNNFFMLELDDTILNDISAAQKWLIGCPYDGILWVWTCVKYLNWGRVLPCKIEIAKDYVNPVVTTHEDNYLLEWGDDLLKLPDVYLTRRFRLMKENSEKVLSTHDKELITTWEKFHKKILEN